MQFIGCWHTVKARHQLTDLQTNHRLYCSKHKKLASMKGTQFFVFSYSFLCFILLELVRYQKKIKVALSVSRVCKLILWAKLRSDGPLLQSAACALEEIMVVKIWIVFWTADSTPPTMIELQRRSVVPRGCSRVIYRCVKSDNHTAWPVSIYWSLQFLVCSWFVIMT